MIHSRLLPLLFVMASACQPGPQGIPRPLTLANVHPVGYPTASALVAFRDEIAADPIAAPVLAVDLQLGGVLGNEKEVLEKVRFGAVAFTCTSVAPLAEFSDAIGVLTLPYLFDGPDEMWRVLSGPVGEALLESLSPDGFVGLTWYDAGARSFYNRVRPVRRLSDLEGLKIRVQRSEIMRDTVAALGATPMTLGFKQVYTNLHSGSLDGAENNVASYRSERHFEVARFFSFDRHSTIPDVLLVNRDVWEELPVDVQGAVRRAAAASTAVQRRAWAEYETAARAALEAAGSEFHEIEDIESFRAAVRPIHDRARARWGSWLDRIDAAR